MTHDPVSPEPTHSWRTLSWRISQVVFSAFCVTIAAKLLALATTAWHAKQTGFHAAVQVLFHYMDALPGLLAFFFVNLFLLAVTLAFDPAVIVVWLRKHAVLPSLRASEHMFSIALGVIVARALIEIPAWTYTHSGALKSLFLALLVTATLYGLAFACGFAATFFEDRYERLVQLRGWSFRAVTIFAGFAMGGLLYWDLVWEASSFLVSFK